MPRETRERQGDKTLLDICLCVHMGTTGVGDPEPAEYMSILEDALKHWEADPENPYHVFDDAVRQLVYVTVQERILGIQARIRGW